ncbi:MAG: 16S rRNA (cytosine(1402)-N(4))-methyltransferase RsmH [Fibrobacteria bacterium]|nr:16S rRNA (cytosine(1402)-N(4))-methyltransferase RsmH [Fibrobacteria bacterium]
MDYHIPVMVPEVIRYMVTNRDGAYLDGTLGGGGHTAYILQELSVKGKLTGMDRDNDAIQHCRNRFATESRLELLHRPFSGIAEAVDMNSLDGLLLDLGVSSHQLDAGSRGFTHAGNGALDMRMNQDEGIDAREYLETVSEEELASVLRYNSDLKRSRTLAHALKTQISISTNVSDIRQALSQVIKNGSPALLARIFQAIRMEVNEELEEIDKGIDGAVKVIRPGGRICVLSYHSVEDRRVKRAFGRYTKACICDPRSPVCMCGGNHRLLKKVCKKPLVPALEEVKNNRRARSAKLRIMEKIESSQNVSNSQKGKYRE